MRNLPANGLLTSARERVILDSYAEIFHIMHRDTVLDLSQSFGRNGPPPNKRADKKPKMAARGFFNVTIGNEACAPTGWSRPWALAAARCTCPRTAPT